jgi:hypothetical protein
MAAITAGVAEIRDDGNDPLGSCPAAGIGQCEQLDEVGVHWWTGGLDDDRNPTADRLEQADQELTVGVSIDLDRNERRLGGLPDGRRKLRMGGTGNDDQVCHAPTVRSANDVG